jgi:hypothetical protein
VRGGDGHLWVAWWSGSAWGWADLGKPPGVTVADAVGVLTVMNSPTSSQRPYAFVIGSDGHLWVDWWNGSAWGWADLGKPAGVAIDDTVGVLTVMNSPTSSQRPYAFVMGSDGHLWVDWWNGSAWGWADLGKPAGATIDDTVGVLTVKDSPTSGQRPYIFMR